MIQGNFFPVYTTLASHPETIYKMVDNTVFDYPFFNDGILVNSGSFNLKKSYTLNNLPEQKEEDLIKVAGFIFHVSHCGSTLLARMLGSINEVRVVSETEAINGLLLSAILYKIPRHELLDGLKKIMDAYRQPGAGKNRLIFKFTSWNIFFIELFKQLFPKTPWIFIDRNEDEVIRSLLKNGGGFADWWHHPADSIRRHFLTPNLFTATKNEYLRQMIEGHRNFAKNNENDISLMVSYPGFIGQFRENILPHFNFHVNEDELKQAEEIIRYDSKVFEKKIFKAGQ